MGFVKPPRYRDAGALLPHRFSFSPRVAWGVFFSVTLSVGSPRPAVSRHPALRSPDFPHHPKPLHAKGAGAAIVQPAFARLIIANEEWQKGRFPVSCKIRQRHTCVRGQAPDTFRGMRTLRVAIVEAERSVLLLRNPLPHVKYLCSLSREPRTSCDDSSHRVRK